MAYNLQSLINILEQILNPEQTRWIVDDNKPQLQSLLKKSVSLQQILDKSPLTQIESLESQIRDATHTAEDVIESQMVDQMLSSPKGVSITFSKPEGVILQQVMKELDSVMEQVVKLIEEKKMSSGSSSSGVSFSHDLSSKSIVQSKAVVGLGADLRQLKDRLMGMQRKLEIVRIVGMGGIGKTTLARKLYQDPLIIEHFKSLSWTTVSQDYNIKAILLSLLRCIIGKELCDQHTGKESNELKHILYKSLYGRRYIIVLDDVWSTELWDEIRRCFPDNNDRSRIVITTRELEVAKHSVLHKMQLLNESESWDLLRQEVFGGEEDFPDAFERIGRNIARNCGGLPLAICVIGGLLSSKANMSEDVWENISNDVTAAAKSDEQFSNVLSLSYNHLPTHLRPCFLYMGAFPEDCNIKASRLIRLWVAEGFLKSNGEKSLEEEAENCLEALVGRNLVSVRAVKSDGKPKSYNIHDLMRDLCLKKAEEQRFLHVKSRQAGKVENESMYGLRRVSLHPSYRIRDVYASAEFMAFARSFLCTGLASRAILSDVFSGLRLLRVLDILEIKFSEFPTEILHIVNLRYLALSYNSNILVPSDISRLCNLQTLVISSSHKYIHLPFEIRHMLELRHVILYKTSVYIESSDIGGSIQENLQRFSTIRGPTAGFLSKIPNINYLGVKCNEDRYDLSHLHKLKTLKFSGYSHLALVSPSELELPPSLRKLSLKKCEIAGEFMKYLSELPKLEVLKLRKCKFEGGEPQEWDASEQEFCKLQFLQLEKFNLVRWRADETNFPSLRRLVIRGCPALEEIPCGIGEIPTLQTIELDECSPSLVASAELIIEEQRENGNDDLQLRM